MSAATPSRQPWDEFTLDPRRPEAAPLRASDRDREVAQNVLAEGYAEGRLDRDEYDERAGRVSAAKTLGELPALIADLVPTVRITHGDLALADSQELQARAEEAWRSQRRSALSGLLGTAVVLSAIWLLVGGDGFFWPAFVIVFAALHLVRVQLHRPEIIARERRRLEKLQRTAQRGRDPWRG